ncbi:uncharacterized, partial [Tachysurus ichikawai]
ISLLCVDVLTILPLLTDPGWLSEPESKGKKSIEDTDEEEEDRDGNSPPGSLH